MKTAKDCAMLPVLVVATFFLGFLYYWGNEFARGYEIARVVNCAIITPVVYVVAIGFAVAFAIGNKSLASVGGLICGVVGAYANLVWSVRCEFSIWLFGLGDLMTAMRMIADMREIHLVFIPITGVGLVVAYWIEAIAIVLGSWGMAIGFKDK